MPRWVPRPLPASLLSDDPALKAADAVAINAAFAPGPSTGPQPRDDADPFGMDES